MDTPALVDQAFRRWELLLSAWNIYLFASFSLLTLVVVVPAIRTDRRVLRLFAIGFAFFAWTHLLGLLYMIKQWAAITAELRLKLESQPGGEAMAERLSGAGLVEAPEAVWVVPFHLLLDAYVLYALWAVSKPPRE